MAQAISELTTEEKRRLLRARLAGGRSLPRTHPTSYSQRRLWFMHRLAPESPAYNVEAALPLGPIDPVPFERAINAIVARHESLRTVFLEVDGEPVQQVLPALHVPLRFEDLSALPEAPRAARLLAIRRHCATEPFDLATGPLLRVRLLRTGADRHLFLLNLHHIIADGWSMGVFSRELADLYAAFLRGEPSPLPDLPLQYGDFARWQRQEMDGPALAPLLAYWTGRLAGMAPLELATDRPRPPVQSHAGAFHNTTFPAGLSEALRRFSAARGVTLFMTLLAGLKALLARCTGQEDIVLGTYIANRDRVEIEGLIGFFLNTLVLRTAVPAEARFEEVLAAVRETALGAYAHQALPFERLVEALRPPRDLSRNPLVQVVFQLQNAASGAGGEAALIDYQRSAAAFDIAITAYEQDGVLHFTWEYATDLFDAATIADLAGRLERLLAEAIRAPQTPVAALEILTAQERAALGPHVPADLSGAPCLARPVGRLLADSLAADPEAPAFYVDDMVASRAQVADCANRIAAALAAHGAVKGSIVGVCLERSVELAATLLAIWKLGAVYLPLDPAYPEERRRFMVADSGARLVVARTAGTDPDSGAVMLDVAAALGDLARPAPEIATVALAPDDPSHIIYTSGSTGKPKGSLAAHRQVLNRLHWMWRVFPYRPWDVEAVKTPTSFIDSLWELVGPLLGGRPALILSAAIMLEPPRLVAALARHGVTRIWVTPSYLRLLLEVVPDLGARLPRLDLWVVTGEALPMELAQAFARAAPGARLVNLYGTSEAWDICWDMVDPAGDAGQGSAPIGRPIDNVDLLVLDAGRRLVPPGVPGELHVAGIGLCLGFVNRPDLDAARLVEVAGPGPAPLRVIATGDRVRWRRDGRLEFIGRTDDELKISGMRVHPIEVEAAVNALPGVARAVVAGLTGADGVARLRAWVVPEGDPPPTPADLRAELARHLPLHMIPETFELVAEFPQTPSGKADRRALVARALAAPVAAPVTDPATATARERLIAEILSDVLAKPVAVDENFFAAGGHSLLAARAVARINDRLPATLGIRDIFTDPTARGLARLAEAGGEGASPAIRRLRRSAVPAEGPEAPPGGAM